MSDTTQATASAPAAAAAAAPNAGDDRYKMIPDPDHPGQRVKRKDFILRRWTADGKYPSTGGAGRGAIAKELTTLVQQENPNAKAIPYQTVFAVTNPKKGAPAGGPLAGAATPAPASTPAASTNTAGPVGASSESEQVNQ